MNSGTCRIIGGKWRGRKILFDDARGLRPTTDRIRETVFNWLQPYLCQSRCLDLFAGSGVLGFEALSRGAQDVILVESNIKTVTRLKENVRVLNADEAHVHHCDAIKWLQTTQSEQSLDLVFLDPPFSSNLLAEAAILLDSSACLAENAIIYLEHNVDADISLPASWRVLKEKKAGQVAYKLYKNSVNS